MSEASSQKTMSEASTTLRTTSTNLKVQQDHLVLGDSLLYQKIWIGSMPIPDSSCLCNLKSLIMEGCEFLSNETIPSHILPSLSNLEELQVLNCNSVKTIFNQTKMNNMGPASDTLSIPLKKLILKQLPILEHVWNEDLQGSLNFPFLEEVLIDGCESIKCLFPIAAPVKMDRLQILHVKKCSKLVEIVAKDAQKAIDKLFSSITSLKLWNLPNLRCIYPGIGILIWPKLEELDIIHCPMLKFFSVEVQKPPGSHPKGQSSWKPSVSLAKVTPHLKLLSLGEREVMMIKEEKLYIDLLELQSLKLQWFNDESSVFAFDQCSTGTPPCIENLVVVHSSFKEIFPSKVTRQYYRMSKLLLQLKGLKLQNLPSLKSIGFEHSWMEYFVGQLETILVKECDSLTNLTPSHIRVSFSNLTEVKVEDCFGLEYLFSSSTANTLNALKEMHVTNCGSIQNIMTNENKNEDENSIITFGKLQFLTLTLLPKIETFYSGSSILNFPSLRKVSISKCYNMNAFCFGEAVTIEELKVTKDGVYTKGDLNDMML